MREKTLPRKHSETLEKGSSSLRRRPINLNAQISETIHETEPSKTKIDLNTQRSSNPAAKIRISSYSNLYRWFGSTNPITSTLFSRVLATNSDSFYPTYSSRLLTAGAGPLFPASLPCKPIFRFSWDPGLVKKLDGAVGFGLCQTRSDAVWRIPCRALPICDSCVPGKRASCFSSAGSCRASRDGLGGDRGSSSLTVEIDSSLQNRCINSFPFLFLSCIVFLAFSWPIYVELECLKFIHHYPNTPLQLSNHYCLCSVCVCLCDCACEIFLAFTNSMDKGKRTMKEALCTSADEAIFSENQCGQNHETQSQKQSEVNPPNVAKTISETISKPSIDMNLFLSKLAGVRQNIQKLKESSLLGYVIGDPVDFAKMISKLKYYWKFVKGSFDIIEKPNLWFEIRFANPIDQKKTWDGRPYHVFGQLLLLKPSCSDFDPFTEPTSIVDMWIRIPHLPVEYISFDVISTIIEMNKLGSLIKLDPFTEKKQKLSYARICINVDTKKVNFDTLIIPNEEGVEKTYKIWFEEFPEGCGNCGEPDHPFEKCPLRIVIHQSLQFSFKNLRMRETPEKEENRWHQVANRKGKKSNENESQGTKSNEPTTLKHIPISTEGMPQKEKEMERVPSPSTNPEAVNVVAEFLNSTILPMNLNPPFDLPHPNDDTTKVGMEAPTMQVLAKDKDEIPVLTEEEIQQLLEHDDLLDEFVECSEIPQKEVENQDAEPKVPEEPTLKLCSVQPTDAETKIAGSARAAAMPITGVSESSKRKEMLSVVATASSVLKGGKKQKK